MVERRYALGVLGLRHALRDETHHVAVAIRHYLLGRRLVGHVDAHADRRGERTLPQHGGYRRHFLRLIRAVSALERELHRVRTGCERSAAERASVGLRRLVREHAHYPRGIPRRTYRKITRGVLAHRAQTGKHVGNCHCVVARIDRVTFHQLEVQNLVDVRRLPADWLLAGTGRVVHTGALIRRTGFPAAVKAAVHQLVTVRQLELYLISMYVVGVDLIVVALHRQRKAGRHGVVARLYRGAGTVRREGQLRLLEVHRRQVKYLVVVHREARNRLTVVRQRSQLRVVNQLDVVNRQRVARADGRTVVVEIVRGGEYQVYLLGNRLGLVGKRKAQRRPVRVVALDLVVERRNAFGVLGFRHALRDETHHVAVAVRHHLLSRRLVRHVDAHADRRGERALPQHGRYRGHLFRPLRSVRALERELHRVGTGCERSAAERAAIGLRCLVREHAHYPRGVPGRAYRKITRRILAHRAQAGEHIGDSHRIIARIDRVTLHQLEVQYLVDVRRLPADGLLTGTGRVVHTGALVRRAGLPAAVETAVHQLIAVRQLELYLISMYVVGVDLIVVALHRQRKAGRHGVVARLYRGAGTVRREGQLRLLEVHRRQVKYLVVVHREARNRLTVVRQRSQLRVVNQLDVVNRQRVARADGRTVVVEIV